MDPATPTGDRPDLTVDELLTTTRTVRRRLDFDRPVPRAVVEECLSLAVQAPTASNRQEWHWVFVTDPATKAELGRLYRTPDPGYVKLPIPDYAPDDTRAVHGGAVQASADLLMERMADAPVLLVPCHLGRVDHAPIATQAALWGSILPAVWNLFLALRSRGLGSAWTSVLMSHEREAAELLGIPHEQYTIAGLFPIAYTVGTDFKPAPRRPLDEIVHWERW